MLAALDRFARDQASQIAAAGWYQNLEAADAELALAAAALARNDRARARTAAQQASEHLARYVAATGVTSGHAMRRTAWAHELVERAGGQLPRGP
jgi:N-acetyl-beta-hexosaminidase